ncbi:MAG: glycerate kinase [Thermoleophilaceae bacterium]
MNAKPWQDATVLVAPDSFKGTLGASRVAELLVRGLELEGVSGIPLPVADGGEGTITALIRALGGEERTERVSDPLGRPVQASYALLADGRRAVVEVARASGLGLVAPRERDAYAATTRGTGQLIASAAAAGAQEIIVAAGGSATTDGGAGAVEAIGRLDPAVRLVVLCDVRTPWEDCARLFGPQKGADGATVLKLERRLSRLARAAPRDPRGIPMTGCGGGLSGGLWAHLGAHLEPGAPFVLDAVGFSPLLRAARFVVTGEGRLDGQTLAGKVVAEVATRARQGGVACHAVVGEEALGRFGERLLDLANVIEAGTEAELLEAGRRLARER